MAIHEEKTITMGGGHTKKLDENAIDMILMNLQRSQYQFPQRSTTRELVCNGIDSVSEKNVARAILTGKAKVEDFFVEREGAVYNDSKWRPDYFDLKWLSDNDVVEMHYVEGTQLTKDRVYIKDQGVGLGRWRLEGFFNLGYSSKRLSKLPLGKFGIGNKSPLSTDIDYYTVESCYNGQKYRFNVYNATVDSLVPKFNMNAGTENQFVLFNEGTPHEYKVYWEPTTEKNGVTVSLEVKKHHKQQYEDAVKSQLLYFDNFKFVIDQADGTSIAVPYKADIQYEDDSIILSDNKYYSKPHILLNKVNYGFINFEELEMEQKYGNIGIKVAPEEVEVNPSRESLRWSDTTKQKILERYKNVVETATKLLQAELSGTDFLKWLRTCFNLSGSLFSRKDIIGRMANIADLSQINPSFAETGIKFKSRTLLEGLYFRKVTYSTEQKLNQYKKTVHRKELKSFVDDIGLPIFLMEKDERASNRKDKWLLSQHPNGFLVLYEPFSTIEKMEEAGMSEEFIEQYKKQLAERRDRIEKAGGSKEVSVPEIYDLIKSSEGTTIYADVEVPEGFKGTEEEVQEKAEEEKTVEDVEEEKVVQLAAAERRKLEGKILVYTPRHDYQVSANVWSPNAGAWVSADGPTKVYSMHKLEIPIKSINEWSSEEVYYGNDGDDELLHLVAMLTRDPHPENTFKNARRYHSKDFKEWTDKKWWRLNARDDKSVWLANGTNGYYGFSMQHFYDNNEITLVKVSKANTKYVRDFLHIQSFFIRIKNNRITMSNLLVKWNTARLIKAKLHEAAFLFNFEQFNPEYAAMYKQLTAYVDKHWREVEPKGQNYYGLNDKIYSDLINHMDNVQKFQDYVRLNPTDTGNIATLAQGLFGNPYLVDGMAVDPEIVVQMDRVLEYAKAAGGLLNMMPLLTGQFNHQDNSIVMNYQPGQTLAKKQVPEALELEIKQYLDWKGILDYGKEPELEEAHTTNLFPDPDETPATVAPAEAEAVLVEDEVEAGMALVV